MANGNILEIFTDDSYKVGNYVMAIIFNDYTDYTNPIEQTLFTFEVAVEQACAADEVSAVFSPATLRYRIGDMGRWFMDNPLRQLYKDCPIKYELIIVDGGRPRYLTIKEQQAIFMTED